MTTPDSIDNDNNGQEMAASVNTADSLTTDENTAEDNAGQHLFLQQIAELQSQNSELQNNYLRALADNENLRRRTQDDISKAHKFAIESFAESIVLVADSLEMALQVEAPSTESLKEGVEMTLKQLLSAFEKHRLTIIAPNAGEKLDPNKHQAISTVPAEQEANTIVNVLQKGYMIADRLLRPALVTVAAKS